MSLKQKLLVVEDDELWRGALAGALGSLELQVTKCDSWLKLIEALKAQTFDFLVTDLDLGTGVDFGVASLRQLADTVAPASVPPTLIITAAFTQHIIQKCYSLRFVRGVIPKTDLRDVERRLAEMIGTGIQLARTVADEPSEQFAVEDRKPLRDVFVVHGRDLRSRAALFSWLRSLGLRPLEWQQAVRLTGKAAPYTLEVVDAGMRQASATIVLLTPDEKVSLSKQLSERQKPLSRLQPRANVLFEAGYALATKPARTILLLLPPAEISSDLHGVQYIKIGEGSEWRQMLVTRLQSAGCEVDLSGSDWLNMSFP